MKRLFFAFAAALFLAACDPDSLRPLGDPLDSNVSSADSAIISQPSAAAESDDTLKSSSVQTGPGLPALLPTPFGETKPSTDGDLVLSPA